MITIDLPVKPYVAKFIRARYGQEVWQIDKSDRIGKILYNMLERIPKRDAYQAPPVLGTTLKVGISHWYANCKGIYLSQEAIKDFSDQIRLELIEEVAEYQCKLKHGIGIKKYHELYIQQITPSGRRKKRALIRPDVAQYFEFKEIVNDVFKQYGITEDDYPFDTFRKHINRTKLPMLIAS